MEVTAKCLDREFNPAIATIAVTILPTVAKIDNLLGGGSKSEFMLFKVRFFQKFLVSSSIKAYFFT